MRFSGITCLVWLDEMDIKMVHKEWLLAEAKNKLTEVLNMALVTPQVIRRRGDTVVMLSAQEYQRLKGEKPSFKQHLFSPPSSIDDLDLNRDKSPMRNIDL